MRLKNILKVTAIAGLCTALFFVDAMAQVPSTAESSRVQKRITMDNLPAVTGERVINIPDYIVTSAPKGADKQTLTLREVLVDDASVYSEAELAQIYGDMLGTKITLADVFGMAERLTIKYRNDGYILTQVVVPPQEIDGGRVRLQVVEGYIDNITVEGEITPPVREAIARMSNELSERPVLRAQDLERYLLLMNDIPGYTVKSVLSPSKTEAGAADMTLFVDNKLWDLVVQADNRGSRYLGPLQVSTALRMNSALGRGEAIDFQIVTAPDGWPDRELDYISFDYTEAVTREGTTLNVGVSHTETEPGFTISNLDIQGRSKNLHLKLEHPFIRSRSQNLFVSAMFDATDVNRSDNFSATPIEDRIRALRFGANYQSTDRFIGVNTFDVTYSKGVSVFNPTKTGTPGMTRANARHDFSKLEAEYTRLQRLTNVASLLAGVKGQKSNHLLLSSEEFGIGGSEYGRAYDSSEIVGEEGLAFKAELQFTDPIPAPVIDGYQVYSYYDVGKVWDRDNTVVKDRERSIASAGFGVRFDVNHHISGSAELALPLTRDVETNADTGARGFFSLKAEF